MTATLTEATFTPHTTRAVLDRACRHAGLNPEPALLLRHQTNAVYLVAGGQVIVKISRPATSQERLHRTLALVRWLAAQGFPTVAPTIHEQPIEVGGCLVTFWPYIPQSAVNPLAAADLGAPLRALHELVPPVEMPALDAVAAIRHSIAASHILTPDEHHLLSAHCDRLAAELPNLRYSLPAGFIHADPQHRNALRTPCGTALIDWDSACIGPREWDLVTIEIHCRRFYPDPREYSTFADAYGADIRAWPGYPILRDLRELRMITTNARKSAALSLSADEVHTRISNLRGGDVTALWNRL